MVDVSGALVLGRALAKGGGLAALVVAAMTDLRRRIIPNEAVLVVAGAGLVLGLLSFQGWRWRSAAAVALGLLVVLGQMTRLGIVGGGDAKLIAAVSLSQPPADVPSLLLHIALAGGGLALIYLALSHLSSATTACSHAFTVYSLWCRHTSWHTLAQHPRGIPPMRGRPILLVLGTLALVAGAALVVFQLQAPAPTVEVVAKVDSQAVLVMARPVKSRALLRPDDLAWKAIAMAAVPTGAYLRGTATEGDFAGAVVRKDLPAGAILTGGRCRQGRRAGISAGRPE